MKLLILGGTVFYGRHLVDIALQRGHEVTLFNRGVHNPDLFPQVEKLRGDRDGGLEVLRSRRWDAVIDPSGYIPRLVRASTELLVNAVEQYVFISTVSVYGDPPMKNMDENAPLAKLIDELVEDITGETYGGLKVLCEKAVQQSFPNRNLVIRPGLIVGPYDPSDRFTYWLARVAHGGRVLAPGDPARPVQFIDVRDLSAWTLDLVERKCIGIYNATGPTYPLGFGDFLSNCQQVIGNRVEWVWVNDEFLIENNIAAYTAMPLWVPTEYSTLDTINCQKAFTHGLNIRPLAETIADTLAWDQTRPPDLARRSGISLQREQELIESWINVKHV